MEFIERHSEYAGRLRSRMYGEVDFVPNCWNKVIQYIQENYLNVK